jgi:hypothetical protein
MAPADFAALTAAFCFPTGAPAADLPGCYIHHGLSPWPAWEGHGITISYSAYLALGAAAPARAVVVAYWHVVELCCQRSIEAGYGSVDTRG